MPFRDRVDAGRRLAQRLGHLAAADVVVLGLPRGGVPVAAEIAAALGADLDVILVRKLGVPVQRELGMGAIGEDGVRILNDDVLRMTGVNEAQLEAVETAERAELDRRAALVRAVRPRVPLQGRTALIVDDGIATGSTAMAACAVARAHGAARVVVAVPVAPPDTARRLADAADEVVCLETPAAMLAIGEWYDDFSQTTDDEVVALLRRAAGGTARGGAVGGAGHGASVPPVDEDVTVGPLALPGMLSVPDRPLGIVVFAHGSGSSRHSPRNRQVARYLTGRGLATLLFDLLTPDEERDRANVFDVELLGRRLADVTLELASRPGARGLPIGYFGASTGAAAALWAAAEPDVSVAAVVSRGGRPDLAGTRLVAVEAPTLFIVGSLDHVVLELNDEAAAQLHCERATVVVPGATHLFEEPGTLDAAATAAGDWFVAHMAPVPSVG
ncbi:MAG TPA: phosphoribosyltransferase family protein [Acidimicrobiales bacterium]|nr:phosphoribosyltransferase family protein [Acidimicrobiales bacterium]